MHSFKSTNYLFLVVFLLFISQKLIAQTELQGGDIAILGVNANSAACGGSGGEDVITFVAFKDITNGTQFDITDNGWERVSAGLWGDSEGTYRMTRTGGTIPAGTSFELTLVTSFTATQTANPDWTFTNLNVPSTLDRNVNMNSGGDQMYVMQGGTWDNGGETGEHDATYNGRILYGFNTRTFWSANGTSQQSNLHPEVDPCFFMNPTGGTTNYVNYTGPTTAATQLEWINRIKEPSNWTSYSNCTDYNNSPPPSFLPISTNDMSVDCTICTGGCGAYNETLVFNLPSTGGPFDVVYTDGTSNFSLSNISDGHTEIVSVSSSITFSLVSVTAANGCPMYSNFAGEAEITFSGSGGPSASLSGGGVLCSDNCTVVTITIAGPTSPPYTLDALVDFPPLLNNFPVTVQVTSIVFDLTVCSQGLIPSYDIATSTLYLPNFITGNLTFTLTGITDNTGCAGTVDPTPFFIDVEDTPTANPAGPLSVCEESGNAATFDLTNLNSTVSATNTITWYEDMMLNTTINNPGNYFTTSTTVYATASTANCESEPVAVQLIVDPSPTANSSSMVDCTPTGTATFDLTSENSTVNGGTGATVSWFTNSAGTNPILNPSSYNSGSGVVYATVTSNGCSSMPVPITLTVNQAPTATPTTMNVCESMAIPTFGDFNLTLENSTVNGGTGLPVSWFTNSSATIPIPGSMITAQNNTTVYAVVGSAPCTSVAVAVTLFVTPFPPAVSTIMEECATFGNQAVFDLTSVENIVNAGSGANVTWFENANGTNQILLTGSYLSSSTFVYAQTSNGLCTSPIQPVELIVTPGITANTTSATACDEGNGTATFNLDIIGLDVNNEPGNTVNWYFDSNATIPISSPYTTGSTNVYAQVTNGVCESQIVTIGLAIDIAPTANITSATECDSGNGTANFDLNVLALDVNNIIGNMVNWYSDAGGNFPISSPYNTGSTIIYADVTNGNCTSPIVPISLNVTPAPTANNAVAAACDLGNGTADFDLTIIGNDVNGVAGNTINWYSDAGATLPIFSPYNTTSTIVYAVVTDGNCTSNIAEIILTVENAPVANSTILDDCDLGNGTADFDLDALALIVNTNPAYTVNWFLNANGTSPILISPFNTPTTLIYAVVSNGAGCESVPTQVDLNVIAAPTANTTSAAACETTNGTATFDLTALENTVNGGSSNTVSWYSDIAAINSISSPYNSGSTTIYAVVNGALCSSQPVAVDLTVNPTPIGIPTDVAVCINDGSGMANFDLTNLANIVNGGTSDPVLWYSDIGTTNQIFSPYNSATTTVYATVTVDNCTSAPVPVDLEVGDQPTANTTSAELCDSGNGTATFDLTALENTISGGTSDPVNFYSDVAGTIMITSPFNTATTTVYATVTVGFCPSELVAINLTVGNAPTANTTSTLLCDEGGGTATFDLTSLENTVGSGNTVNWYADLAATNSIASPYVTATTTIYAVVGDADCTSDPVEIDLIVENLPTAIATTTSLCDDGNGTATFDLTSLENTINGGNGNTVLWYSDANATTTIASPFLTAATTIYAIVDDGNCLSNTVAVDLNVTTAPSISTASATLCDEGSGMANFDLTALENTVNGGNGNTVTWYSDANGTTTITSPFNSETTTIYAIVSDGNCTSPIEAINLTVADLPEANATTIANCDSGNGTADFDLTAIANTVNGGSGNPVTWYSDINLTNAISSPFNSTATIIYAVVNDVICTAAPVEVTLEITNDISANPTSLAACDDGTGMATFDLTDLSFQNNITGGNGNSISWFVDAAATNPLAPPFNAYQTVPTSIYAVVVSGNCSSSPVEISLELSPEVPSADNLSLSNCDYGNGTSSFDLDSQAELINTGNGNQVVWAEDAGFTIQITSPFVSGSTTIYAIATDGICFSEIVEVELLVTNFLTGNPTTAFECDTNLGFADFDLDAIAPDVNSNVLNTVTWFSDANATIPISSPYNTQTTTVYAVVNNGPCQSQPVAVVLEVTNATPAFPTTDTQCDDGSGSATFDLDVLANTVNGGNGLTVNWFSDAAATNPIATPFTSAPTTVYAFVENGNCSSDIVEISLEVSNNLTAFPTTDSQCDDGSGTATFDLTTLENNVNGGNGNTVNWYSDASATTPSATTITSGNTSVYAIVTDGNCASQIVEITLTVENNLTAFPTTDSQCDDGSGTATFDLTVLENTVNGGNGNTVNWYSDASATTPSATTITSGNTSVYAIVTDGNCASQIVEITLTVENNLTAFPTTDSQCDDGSGTATFDLTTLENTVNGGNGNTVTWYSDAGATLPSATTITSGNTSVYAIVTDGNCASQIVEITLTIENNLTAFPTTDSQCDDGSGTATFDLTTLENTVNGGNGNTVTWYSDAGATTPSATTITSGNTSVYAIVTDGNCASQIVEITLTVENNLTAFPTTDSQCDDGSGTATFDLTTLENNVNGGNGNTVNWYSDASATTPSATTITSGNTSVFAIVTDGNCASQIVEITLTVENNLTAFPTTDSQCDDGSGTATFDLTTLENNVNGGNGNTVIWYSDASATTPSATTITSGNTSVYAIVTDGNCTSQIVEITLTVENNLTAFPTTDSQCDDGSGTATFDLTTLENTVNGGNGNTVNWYSDAGATTPSATTITSGNTSVYAVVTDGNCASQIVEITLTVENNLTAFPTTDSQCDDGSGTATFDLTVLENTVNGGNGNTVNWYSDASATTPSPTTITSGNTSVFAIVTDGNCFSQAVEIELSITSFSTNDIIQTLCDGESIMVNNITYDESNASGTEIIAGGSMNGCDSIITVDLTFEPEITGTISASTNSICSGNDVVLTFTLTGGTTYDVEFSEGSNPPTILNGISDGHTITVAPTATTTYSLEAVTPLNTNCIAIIPTTQITIQVEEIDAVAQPTSQFGIFNISCFNENDGAAVAVPTSGIAPFQFLWSNGNTSPTIENIFAGEYEVTITDAAGCSAITSTTLTQPDEIQLEITTIAPPCSAAFDGQIILNNISGGSGTYSYSLDGSGFTPVQNNPTVVDFISPGEHSLIISDDNGCQISDQVFVSEPLELEVNLGSDETIELGDSIEIQSMPNFIPAEIIWSTNSNCDSCLTQFVTPTDQSTYIVTMVDENGCVASDSITILVEKNQHVFIPNAFTPDDNGFNDIFFINAGQDVAEVKNFRIFNRWGEVVFENKNFQPNNPMEGWDGFFNGEKLNPNVFVFFAEIEFKDGVVKIYKGDVTLTR